MPLAVLTARAQSNDYNMVIELKNGTKITLGANDVEDLTFNGDALSISGNTIEDIIAALATKADKSELTTKADKSELTTKADKSEIERLEAMISQLQEDLHPTPLKEYTVNGVSFKMVRVPGGTFQMGATEEQGSDAWDEEKPVHEVTLSDYWIGETEVTQELWYAVMGQRPTSDGSQWSSSYGLGDNYPAYLISWDDCQEFITSLNQLTGLTFRLPTEAEWEFAARGGNSSQGYKYAGSNTIGDVACYRDNSFAVGSSSPDFGTHPVATKSPNELGLYDMSGNIIEWCQDWYGSYSSSAQTDPVGPSSGSDRVCRGGCWLSLAKYCRVSYRDYYGPSYRHNSNGLRLAL